MAANGRPRRFESVESLEKQISGYFKECAKNVIKFRRHGVDMEVSEPLTVSGLCDHLSLPRQTLFEYASGRYGDGFSDAIKKARAKIERDKVSRAMLGLYDKTICIFDLKNNHGWKDQPTPESSETPAAASVTVNVVDGRKPDAD